MALTATQGLAQERQTVETAQEPGLAEAWRELGRLPRAQARERLGYSLKRPLFALPLYGWSLGRGQATALALVPSDPWPGSAERGQALMEGHFDLAGETVIEPDPIWAPAGAGLAWRRELHGFLWLRDLRAMGGDGPRRTARALVKHWLASHAGWHPLAWEPAVTG